MRQLDVRPSSQHPSIMITFSCGSMSFMMFISLWNSFSSALVALAAGTCEEHTQLSMLPVSIYTSFQHQYSQVRTGHNALARTRTWGGSTCCVLHKYRLFPACTVKLDHSTTALKLFHTTPCELFGQQAVFTSPSREPVRKLLQHIK